MNKKSIYVKTTQYYLLKEKPPTHIYLNSEDNESIEKVDFNTLILQKLTKENNKNEIELVTPNFHIWINTHTSNLIEAPEHLIIAARLRGEI